MPRRRKSVAPQTETHVLLERIETLERRLAVAVQAKMSAVQVVDIENFNQPLEGMAAIDWPTGRFCWYHDGIWICVPSNAVHAIKIFSDRALNRTGDGLFRFPVTEDLDGWSVSWVAGANGVKGTTDTTIQISHATAAETRGVDILSTPITVPANFNNSYEGGIPPVIDPAQATVSEGEMLWINADAVGTGSKGMAAIVAFSPPKLDNTV